MTDVDVGRQKARQALDSQRPADALAIARQGLDEYGWDSQTAYIAGQAMFRLRDFAQAEEMFRRIVAHEPANALAVYYVGLCRERLGDQQEALSLYRTALTLEPNMPEARKKLGQTSGGVEPQPANQDTDLRSTLATDLDNQPPGPEAVATAGDLLYSGRPRIRGYPGRLLVIAGLLVGAGLAPRAASLVADGWIAPRASSVGDPVLTQGLEGLAAGLPTAGIVILVVLGLIGAYLAINLLLTWIGSRYDIYERRIDLVEAGFHTRYDSIWLYEIKDVRLEIPPLLALAGTARLYVRCATRPARDPEEATAMQADAVHVIPGVGGRRFMKKLWEELRDAAVVERRAMHRWWL